MVNVGKMEDRTMNDLKSMQHEASVAGTKSRTLAKSSLRDLTENVTIRARDTAALSVDIRRLIAGNWPVDNMATNTDKPEPNGVVEEFKELLDVIDKQLNVIRNNLAAIGEA